MHLREDTIKTNALSLYDFPENNAGSIPSIYLIVLSDLHKIILRPPSDKTKDIYV